MERLLIIDRVEGDFAVCETPERQMVEVPLSCFPQEVSEGDCFLQTVDGLTPQPEETAKRRAINKALQDKLFGR